MAINYKVGIAGILGKMGRTVAQTVEQQKDMRCVGGTDVQVNQKNEFPLWISLPRFLKEAKPDVLVDFTVGEAAFKNIKQSLRQHTPCVVGTTGLSSRQLQTIKKESRANKTPCFIAPNFSVGAVLLMQFAKQASSFFESVEIVEYHHDQKKDAPSGTAIRTASLLGRKKDPKNLGYPSRGELHSHVPVHSIRLRGMLAHQEVLFGKAGEVLTIRHDALSRECFMEGVLIAIRKVKQLKGLVIGLENLL